jgi:anti-sigma regulatory factor (Ser/Thr protein kinase)
MADVQIAISRVSNPLFIKEASPIDRSLIGTMVSELATNIIKYAGRGLIRMTRTKGDGTLDIEMWAEDKGPGISNISMAMKDHFTTGNTLGLGLPGVRRMADEFAIQSERTAQSFMPASVFEGAKGR